MKINTTESVASESGISPERVRQIVKILSITPIHPRPMILSDRDAKRVREYQAANKRPGPKRK
jgi:hypothetical protein